VYPARKGQTSSIDLQYLHIIFKAHINFNIVSIMLTKFPYSISFSVWVTYVVNCKLCLFVLLTKAYQRTCIHHNVLALIVDCSISNCYYMQLVTIRCSIDFNPLNAELNPICHLLTLLGGATIVVVSRLRVKHRLNLRVPLVSFLLVICRQNITVASTTTNTKLEIGQILCSDQRRPERSKERCKA
jgi:hypothetical protein